MAVSGLNFNRVHGGPARSQGRSTLGNGKRWRVGLKSLAAIANMRQRFRRMDLLVRARPTLGFSTSNPVDGVELKLGREADSP